MSLFTAIFVGRPDGGSVTSISPVARGHYDFLDGWGGHFALPFSYIDASTPAEPGGSTIRFGNIAVGAHKRVSWEKTSLIVGFDVALPTGWVPDDPDPAAVSTMRSAFATSAAAHGNRAYWLWTPEQLGLVVSGAASHRFDNVLDVFAEAAIASLIPVGNERTDVDLFIEAAIGAAWVVPELLDLGLMFQVALLPTGPADLAQTSLELFGRVWLDTLYFALGFTMNLDPALGFAFADGGIWGLHVGVGARF
jgi:hypothetical protein